MSSSGIKQHSNNSPQTSGALKRDSSAQAAPDLQVNAHFHMNADQLTAAFQLCCLCLTVWSPENSAVTQHGGHFLKMQLE